MNISKTTKMVCNLGLGIALYVALSLCVQVPVFENYYICLGYIVMLAYCYIFGSISGAVVGGLGCILYCVLTNGLRGMPGWTLANIVMGIVLGLQFKWSKNVKNARPLIWLLDAVVIVAITAVGMFGVKSITECLLYAQPWLVRAGKNLYAFVSDAVVLVVSLPICIKLNSVWKKRQGNL